MATNSQTALENRPWTFLRRLLACSVATMLLAGGYLGEVLDSHYRFFMMFDGVDTAALLFLFTAVIFLATVGLHGVAKITGGRSDKWLSPWFCFFIVLVVFNFWPTLRLSLVPVLPWLSGVVYYLLIWGLGGLLTAGGYCNRKMRRSAVVGWRNIIYFSALIPIVVIQLLLAPRWPSEKNRPSNLGKRPAGEGAPIMLVVLDTVTYDDMFAADGNTKEELQSLKEFSDTATVYHRARSPGDGTGTSIPGILLQEEVGPIHLEGNEARWRLEEPANDPMRKAEEFARALPYSLGTIGYRRALIGYYLPYTKIMPQAFDAVFADSFYGYARGTSVREGFAHALFLQILRFIGESKDPLSAVVKVFVSHNNLWDQHYRNINSRIRAEGINFFQTSFSRGDFVVLHLFAPHPPFLFAADGGPSAFGRTDPAGYPDQLVYANRVFGEWMQALRDSGLWDESWVIMTSDHGPHFRGDEGEKTRHVPLMIKAPNQTERRDHHEAFRLVDLRTIPGFPLAGVENGKGELESLSRGDAENAERKSATDN